MVSLQSSAPHVAFGSPSRPLRVVVLGAGYGGVMCANRLASRAGKRVAVKLVNATAEFRERVRDDAVVFGQAPAVRPIRDMLHRQVEFEIGTVEHLDAARCEVRTSEKTIPFDHVVVALGSKTATPFAGAANAHTLDGRGAKALANVLATSPSDVTVVGGGATAVELAMAIARRPDRPQNVSLVSPSLLSGFDKKLRDHVASVLDKTGVTVMDARVDRLEVDAAGRQTLQTSVGESWQTVAVLAAGLRPVPLVSTWGLTTNAAGCLKLEPTLQAIAAQNVWGVGDCATLLGVPSGCKSAIPMGAHVADNLHRLATGRPATPFAFADIGSFLALGPKRGVMQLKMGTKSVVLKGAVAAWAKRFINAYAFRSGIVEKWRLRYSWPRAPLTDERRALGSHLAKS